MPACAVAQAEFLRVCVLDMVRFSRFGLRGGPPGGSPRLRTGKRFQALLYQKLLLGAWGSPKRATQVGPSPTYQYPIRSPAYVNRGGHEYI